MKTLIKKCIRSVPGGKFFLEYRSVKGFFNAEKFPPGHYYSVVPDRGSLILEKGKIYDRSVMPADVDIRAEEQRALFNEFAKFKEYPPFYDPSRRIRFRIDNESFSYDDAPVLYSMLRAKQPRRIVEIGSGHSSSCMLDVNQLYFNDSIDCTFIDIDINNPRMNLSNEDRKRVRLIQSPVQDTDISIFSRLEENDLLFVDSSHVSKVNSDVHTIVFKILPALAPGVIIHFHDILYPFEYPLSHAMEGVFWNENYLLHAFLQNNDRYRILFWLNSLINLNVIDVKDVLDTLPLDQWRLKFNKNASDYSLAGGSLYIRKM